MVKTFPAKRRMSFYDTHSGRYDFPFAAVAHNHHKSGPDISASFPGQTLTAESFHTDPWGKIALVIEAKGTAKQDPFYPDHHSMDKNVDTIQVARNARNLLLRHGFLAAFVLGVYGTTARIARFDHSCAIVSQPFDIHKEPKTIQRFLDVSHLGAVKQGALTNLIFRT